MPDFGRSWTRIGSRTIELDAAFSAPALRNHALRASVYDAKDPICFSIFDADRKIPKVGNGVDHSSFGYRVSQPAQLTPLLEWVLIEGTERLAATSLGVVNRAPRVYRR